MFFKLKRPVPTAIASEESERSIALQGHRVDYKLVRRRGRRGVGLKVDGTGMTVAVSLSTPVSAVEDMIGKNAAWVLKKLDEWSHRRIIPQTWQTGTTIFFMGDALTLMLDVAADSQRKKAFVESLMGHLFVRGRSDDGAVIEKAVVDWYKKQALPHFAQRAFFFAKLHGLVPPHVFLSSANGRWGSCNSRREVRFSWRLIKARPALIDYVVCHELAHLRHMNHSMAFWQEVERMCPDYRELKAELDANDHKFRAFWQSRIIKGRADYLYHGLAPIVYKECPMVICPVAIAVGCKKCPIFKVCPAKSIIGDQKPTEDDKRSKPASKAKKPAKG